MRKELDMKYFKDNIESSLCRILVNRRVAELTGFDVKELDDFIATRGKDFKESLGNKSLIEMMYVVHSLAELSEQEIRKALEELNN